MRVFTLLLCAALLFSLAACSHRSAPRAITPKLGTREKGIASWYGDPYHGRATASGEIYNMELDTAAHRQYAFGTWVRVDNLDNGQRTEVRINDRGPFVRGRIIDLSRASARRIDMLGPGTARVRLTVIAPPPRRDASRRADAVVTTAPAPSSTSLPLPSKGSARWAVQVAAFRSQEAARQRAGDLNAAGHRAQARASGPLWRVIVLPSDGSREQAQQLLHVLASAFPGAFVVTVDTE